jgi:hypothetical protein
VIWARWVHAAGCAHDLGRVGEYRAAAVLLQANPSSATHPNACQGSKASSDDWPKHHAALCLVLQRATADVIHHPVAGGGCAVAPWSLLQHPRTWLQPQKAFAITGCTDESEVWLG